MIIENLTRFLPACSIDKVPMPVMMQTFEEDSYVRFLDAKVASSNSLQQLKAEILPLSESGIRYCNANGLGSVKSIFERIAAKLSAV